MRTGPWSTGGAAEPVKVAPPQQGAVVPAHGLPRIAFEVPDADQPGSRPIYEPHHVLTDGGEAPGHAPHPHLGQVAAEGIGAAAVRADRQVGRAHGQRARGGALVEEQAVHVVAAGGPVEGHRHVGPGAGGHDEVAVLGRPQPVGVEAEDVAPEAGVVAEAQPVRGEVVLAHDRLAAGAVAAPHPGLEGDGAAGVEGVRVRHPDVAGRAVEAEGPGGGGVGAGCGGGQGQRGEQAGGQDRARRVAMNVAVGHFLLREPQADEVSVPPGLRQRIGAPRVGGNPHLRPRMIMRPVGEGGG